MKNNLIFSFVYFFRQSSKFLSNIFTKIKGATFGGNLDPYYFFGIKHSIDCVKDDKKFRETLIFVVPIIIIAVLQLFGLNSINFIKFIINIIKIIICICAMLYIKNKNTNIDLYKICKIVTVLFVSTTVISLFFRDSSLFWRTKDYTNVFDLRRLQLFYLEPSELGFHISIIITILFSLFLKESDKKKKIKLLFLTSINFFPLYLSKSLGAIGVLILTVLLVVIYDLIFNFKKSKLIVIGIGILALIIFGMFLIQSNNSLVNRFMRVVNGEDGSVNYRVNVSLGVLQESLVDYNYFGCGFGNVNTPEFIQQYSDLKLDQMVVNSFIYFWIETGILGIIYWLVLMIYISVKCYKSKDITKMALFSYIIIFQFLGSHFTNGLIWLIYGYIILKENEEYLIKYSGNKV